MKMVFHCISFNKLLQKKKLYYFINCSLTNGQLIALITILDLDLNKLHSI